MLPVQHRLKSRKHFNNIFQRGKNFSNDVLIMKVGPGVSGKPTRLGFGVGIKFSKKAVLRNQVKRWMREAVRKKIDEIKPGCMAVFFINTGYPKEKLNAASIEKNVNLLLKKAKLLD